MLIRSVLISAFAAVSTGCAGPRLLPTMARNDPTNADAVEAPLPSRSTTLNADPAADTQPTPESTTPMHMSGMSGMSGKMKAMDMKSMDMKEDGSMPGMQNRPTSGRSE